jgi:F0F1-type ATP synthase alpha subunit
LDTIPTKDIVEFEQEIYGKLNTTHKSLIDTILAEKSLTPEIEASIKDFLHSSIQEFLSVNAAQNA